MGARLEFGILGPLEVRASGTLVHVGGPRQRALLAATDELVKERTVTDGTWQQLATHLDRRQLIEFCLLATQYDGLAATLSALRLPLDNPR